MAACPPPAQQFCVAEERSGHCAVVDGNFLYVWGGYVSIEENEVYLPNDELWLYEIDSGLWTMHLMEGELPTSMSGSCGACINGKLYIFGGFDDKGYSNRLYYVNLRTRNGTYKWKKITDFKGQPPTPRDKLSCWVYKDRLIYFGGYGCRKHNELSDCFDVHDAFWEGQIFWGWHNDVHAFDTNTQTWFQPTIRGGVPPQPRAAHTCAVLGNKGYIFGGRVLQTRMSDLHCLNLDTWIWSGRLWHTACLGTEGEVMIFGGSKDDLHFLDTGHCSDLLIFQTQPYSLLRLCLDCIGKNASLLKNQISWLPSKILPQVLKKITFWAAANHRQEKKAEIERQEQINVT
ncbi:kelch domain-containing protein 1 isoform X4 [Malaclemys terrapin pileata]|uniref:kelch domain-containing protein 1 isoform X5 n=1 Tax=Chrysemys picta bellii TaxID=8478 RepID=UPI00046BEC86|nr:kelch domain-containing protein 1 isoform X4 [Chrysemys picta bellii]XP_053883947.1 kelch domain-containing protein 1 isoform X4 [Malaclemys terrapin pileata]